MSESRNVAILIFNEVEVLDFCGPFEVFAVTRGAQDAAPFNVYTVAETAGPILARNGLSINPRYTIADCPPPDLLIVPGGYGARQEMHNERVIAWIKECAGPSELVLSVCTGALLLANAGLLHNLAATTHHRAFDLLRAAAPQTTVREGQRFVDNGKVITSAGISAGIDMSLHVVARLLGVDAARETAQQMEYCWQPEA
jgi:transcriptional regulator GlxA family with amidase domain